MAEQSVPACLAEAREAGRRWRGVPVGERLRVVGAARRLLARDVERLLESFDWGRSAADTVTAEILPLADAARFLEREAAAILAPRRPRGRRPVWLAGVRSDIRREPCGVVLIVAPGNYPLFLPGVQMLQALAAGNAVCVKPPPGRAGPVRALARMLGEAGLPGGVLHVLDESAATGEAAVRAGFDKIVLTGSATTGARVLAAAAETLTPCVMELSGNDPLFVLPGADLDLVADCIAWGLRLNAGATCIAPRRVLVCHAEAAALERRLRERLAGARPLPLDPRTADRLAAFRRAAEGEGAAALGPEGAGPLVLAGAGPVARREVGDLFGPVCCLIRVADTEEALAIAGESPHALGASIFGPARAARALAHRVDAGSLVINDLVAPTADPRLPFGGRRRSGFGVTRGAEGLLEMTVVKVVSRRRGGLRAHLAAPAAGNPAQLAALIRATHGSGTARIRAALELLRSGWRPPSRSRPAGGARP